MDKSRSTHSGNVLARCPSPQQSGGCIKVERCRILKNDLFTVNTLRAFTSNGDVLNNYSHI